MMRASCLTSAALALAALSSAGCREIQGQCSSRSDTLCLQIGLTDRSVIPDELQLNLSAGSASKPATFSEVGAILSQRPYVVEIELASPLPAALTIDAGGYLKQTGQKIAGAQLTLAPASASRPTVLNLAALGGGGGDGGLPSDLPPGADLRPANWGMVYFSPGKPLTSLSGTTAGGLTIMATGAGQLVVRGDGKVFAARQTSGGTATVSGVWLASATSAWACDRAGVIYATTDGGMTWNSAASVMYPLNAIYGRSTSDILAVGDSTVSATHFDGSMWRNAPHNAGLPFYGVWGSSSTYYIAGGSGQGGRSPTPETAVSWTAIANLNGMTLRGMSGLLSSDAFPVAVGDAGTVEYFQTATGKWQDLGFPNKGVKLAAAWVTGAANGFVVGSGGTVYFYNNGVWISYGNSNLNGYDLTGIWGDGTGGVWVSASNGTDGAIFKY